MSSIKNNYLHIYFYTQTILPLQISDEELSRAEQQEAIETLKPIQKSTINMFGHLNLLAALFFIGTLKGELNQLQLNGDFSVHSEKISQKIVNIKAHFIIFNMKSALNKTLKLGDNILESYKICNRRSTQYFPPPVFIFTKALQFHDQMLANYADFICQRFGEHSNMKFHTLTDISPAMSGIKRGLFWRQAGDVCDRSLAPAPWRAS